MKRGDAPGDGPCLLTGATGFLGGHLMAELLARGRRLVIAGRPAGGESLADRIRRLLGWFGMQRREAQLEFLETDFLKPGLGLGSGEYERLRRRGLAIIHCASDTRFAEKNRAAVMAANVTGLAGILELALRSRARCFHLLSSAYAAGIDHSDCREAPVRSLRFNNPYEESKALAEKAVSATCRAHGLPFTIIRPAIVYGDARTGRSLRFNALYHPVRSLLQLRDIYLADIRENGGKRSAASGIRLEDGGGLRLPIRIFIPREGKINLVSVDYFTAAALAILERPEDGAIYHLTSRRPASMTRLAEFAERFLGLSGVEVVIGAAGAARMRNPAEELFDLFIRPYRPYIADCRDFSRENADRATGGAQPPDFDYAIFRRCMEFAVAADWGKKLF
ncbi:MAG: SDR family oxidoreductase [Acidobacteria bacterium]|jgi:nucleoside-diphosphate-sugar epimerase|nr:SDR family oxidoreductase [Acidobacteriota bacterium]